MRLQRFLEESGTGEYLRHTYCGQSFSLRYGSFKKRVMSSRAAQGYTS